MGFKEDLEAIERENTRRADELLARAKADAASRGKEPFDLDKLDAIAATRTFGGSTREERAHYFETRYYVDYPRMMTLADFAEVVKELAQWT